MAKSRKNLRSHCPINFGLESFGDKWSLLILRDIIFRGKKTYGEFLKSEEGFSTNILAARLKQLEEEGILTRRPNPDNPRREFYVLTEKGLDLIPVLFEMMLWSYKYDPKSEANRITKLMGMIRGDNRKISQKVMARIRDGQALFPEYLD